MKVLNVGIRDRCYTYLDNYKGKTYALASEMGIIPIWKTY